MNLLAPVLLAVLAQPGTDPQKLFLAMEEKITNATSVQITFEAAVDGPKGKGTARGKVVFAPKGKLRATVDLDFENKKSQMAMVSDGKQVVQSGDGKPGKAEATPEFLSSATVTMASKFGVAPALLLGTARTSAGDKRTNPFAGLKTTDFKLGKVEMIGETMAQV